MRPAGRENAIFRCIWATSRRLDLALLFQHADALAQRRYGVLELGLAMCRRDDAAWTAVEVDPAGHHRQPELVHDPGLAIAEKRLRRLIDWVEAGRGDRSVVGVGEDMEIGECAVSCPRH